MSRVKVSSKHQIAVPSEARKRLNIKVGDILIVEVVGDHLVLMREPEDWAKYLEGLGKELWEGVDAQEYVKRERAGWDR